MPSFVAKFSSPGVLTNSTFLGGNPQTDGFGIATDSQGRAYVVGTTVYNCTSAPSYECFPPTPGAVIPPGTISQNGNGFVSVFDPNLSTLLYSTLTGRREWAWGTGDVALVASVGGASTQPTVVISLQ